ncbi:MAG: hypothetical protein FWF83_03035 [Clostridiales bacterium]|nr:hypothetical protein [Clostridiales bacterium]
MEGQHHQSEADTTAMPAEAAASALSPDPVASFWDRMNAAVFLGFIGVFFLLNLLVKPPAILLSERRAPASAPELSIRSIASGSFMRRFEDYAADRFVFRDGFRTVKSAFVFGVYLQTDKNGLYFGDAGVGEFKALDPDSARQTAEKIRKAAETIAALSPGCSIYYSMIPDKSIFAGCYLPGLAMGAAEAILSETLASASPSSGATAPGAPVSLRYISLEGCLDAGSYYRTDIHWDQSRIAPVADRLCGAMGAPGRYPGAGAGDAEAAAAETVGSFLGGYAGQMALPLKPDTMRYDPLPSLRARRLNDVSLQFEDCRVYDPDRLHGVDPYDFFLLGPQAIIRLENPDAPEGVLYLFRDSYGSSLGPLMAAAYRHVVLIDLRYIDMRVLDQFVDFQPESHVLFLFSTQILNNPSVLKA